MRSSFEINGVKITWLGHATFLIQWNGKNIYIDPFVVKEGLPKADYVFITHKHFDHCSIEALRKILKENTIVVIPEDCKLKVSRVTRNIKVVEIGKKYENPLKFETVPGYNVNKPFHKKGEVIGYILDLDGTRIYHSGDTDRVPEMKKLKDITVALLPVGGVYTMDLEEAVEAVKDIKPKYFIPMHYNYLPELRISESKLQELKEKLKDVCEVIILEPLIS